MQTVSISRRSLAVSAGVLLLAGGTWAFLSLSDGRGAAPSRISVPRAAATPLATDLAGTPPSKAAVSSKQQEPVVTTEPTPTRATAPASGALEGPTPVREAMTSRSRPGSDGVVELGAHSRRDPKLALQGGHPRMERKASAARGANEKKVPARLRGTKAKPGRGGDKQPGRADGKRKPTRGGGRQ